MLCPAFFLASCVEPVQVELCLGPGDILLAEELDISRNERSNDAKQLLLFVHFRDISVYHPIDNEWESFIFCYIQLPKCATSGSLSISLYGMYETKFKMVFRILSLELRVRQGYQNI